MTITCGIQSTGVVTMAMEVLHNTCNMCICDLPDMYILGIQHTYQANPSSLYYNHYINI